MNDRQMKHLMDRMHTLSGSIINAHEALNEPGEDNQEVIEMAERLKGESSLLLAEICSRFINEIIDRRHETGNFQYPFEPFDEWNR